jgi:hypothetical protein
LQSWFGSVWIQFAKVMKGIKKNRKEKKKENKKK